MTADEILAGQLNAEREAALAATETEELRARSDAAITAGRLSKLIDNPDVQWFLETFADPLVKTEHDNALSTKRTAAERDISAHRHDLAMEFRHLLETKQKEYAAKCAEESS